MFGMRFIQNPESIPEEVERYYEEVIDDNPDYSESQAWATAWSIYCKHKNPDSPHCRKDRDEYFQNPHPAVIRKVFYQLRPGDQVVVYARDLRRPRQLAVQSISDQGVRRAVFVSSGRTRGPRGGSLHDYGDGIYYQPTMRQQVRLVEELERIPGSGFTANAKAIWVPENYVPHSREDLLGTKRSGYEPADMKWLIGQAKRMGGLPGYTSMERSSLDNIWYEVAAYRDWTEPVDRGLGQVFTADAAGLRAAKRYAKELVESDVAAVAEVRGFARFTSSRRGFDTHFIEELGRYQTPPD
jgi:hypothetical protein